VEGSGGDGAGVSPIRFVCRLLCFDALLHELEDRSMTKYNGHPNWSQWNVSLWINNDEGLYNLARMLEDLNGCGITQTPDGARYTVTSIKHAMVEM
jgi:hypothetical protein